MTTKLDLTKPLELTDGTPVTLRRVQSGGAFDGAFNGGTRSFNADGTPFFSSNYALPYLHGRTVRNVAEFPTLDLTKTLQTRDGKPAKFLGKLDDGRLAFEVEYKGYKGHAAVELRYADGRKTTAWGVTSGDDVVEKPVVKTQKFRNVYADGSIGTTAHKTEDAARFGTKYGKVRIAILVQDFEDGKLVDARVVSSVTPWFRSAGVAGRAATKADFTA